MTTLTSSETGLTRGNYEGKEDDGNIRIDGKEAQGDQITGT